MPRDLGGHRPDLPRTTAMAGTLCQRSAQPSRAQRAKLGRMEGAAWTAQGDRPDSKDIGSLPADAPRWSPLESMFEAAYRCTAGHVVRGNRLNQSPRDAASLTACAAVVAASLAELDHGRCLLTCRIRRSHPTCSSRLLTTNGRGLAFPAAGGILAAIQAKDGQTRRWHAAARFCRAQAGMWQIPPAWRDGRGHLKDGRAGACRHRLAGC